MKITVTFRHLDHTESLDERIHEKSEKLAKYFDGNINLKWSCWVKEGNHYAEAHLHGPQFDYHAHGHTDSLYKTIDVVIDKLEKQVSKKKDKWKGKKAKQVAEAVCLDPENAWADYDEDHYEDVG